MRGDSPLQVHRLALALLTLSIFTAHAKGNPQAAEDSQTEAAQAKAAHDQKSSWTSHAESRLKSIYDRGEYRAKNFRPNWLSDSSGFVLEEVDLITQKRTSWFYDAQTGDRRVATEDEVATIARTWSTISHRRVSIGR